MGDLLAKWRLMADWAACLGPEPADVLSIQRERFQRVVAG
jgi:hypothetical protein